jgi:hypothetical protein
MRGLERVGRRRPIVGGNKFDAKKISNKKYTVTLGGHRSMNLHTTTNQIQAPIMEEGKERRGDRQGSAGGCKSIVLGAIAVKQMNETKKKL